MQWTVLNAFGGLTWVAGLTYAKGTAGPAAAYLPADGHNLVIGAALGVVGLSVLLWANLRSAS